MAKSSNSILPLVLIAAVALILGVVLQQNSDNKLDQESFNKAILLPKPRAIPEFELQTHQGNEFNSEDLKNKWSVLFFGFTHCPDICPSTMYELKQVKEQLQNDDAWNKLQVVFVSVDPERDTVERLANYVPFYDPEFIGVTGKINTITEFAKNLGILFVAHEADESGNYDVDHSASIILVNPNGEYAGVISAPHKKEELVHDLAVLTSRTNSKSSAQQASSQMAENVDVVSPWIRPAPPSADALAAYLSLENKGSTTVILSSASSPIFDEVMIHTTEIKDEIASMTMLEEVEIRPNQTVAFEPLDNHLMLMEPENEINIGDVIPIRLEFKDSSSLDIDFQVGELDSNFGID